MENRDKEALNKSFFAMRKSLYYVNTSMISIDFSLEK